MKKKIFITVALIAFTSITHQLVAQEAILKTRTKSNQTNEKSIATNQLDCVVKIKPTENGCFIIFDNAIVSPRDAASGLPTGKRMHKPVSFFVSPSDKTIVEVKSSNDMVSTQAKSTTKQTTSSEAVSKTTGTPIGGIIVKGGKNPGGKEFDNIVVTDGEFPLPPDLTDGEYELTISFTYQKMEMMNNSDKTSKSYVSGRFIIEIDGSAFRSIRESGVSVKSNR
jgi:hypothetical protein